MPREVKKVELKISELKPSPSLLYRARAFKTRGSSLFEPKLNYFKHTIKVKNEDKD